MCLALVDWIFNSVKNKVQEIHHPQIHWLTAGRERLILVSWKANAQMLILCNNMQNNLAAGSWGEKRPRPLTSSLRLLHFSRDCICFFECLIWFWLFANARPESLFENEMLPPPPRGLLEDEGRLSGTSSPSLLPHPQVPTRVPGLYAWDNINVRDVTIHGGNKCEKSIWEHWVLRREDRRSPVLTEERYCSVGLQFRPTAWSYV